MSKNCNNCNYNMQYLTATVEPQKYENLYSLSEALCNGTIFMDLNIPFECYKNNPIMNPFK